MNKKNEAEVITKKFLPFRKKMYQRRFDHPCGLGAMVEDGEPEQKETFKMEKHIPFE